MERLRHGETLLGENLVRMLHARPRHRHSHADCLILEGRNPNCQHVSKFRRPSPPPYVQRVVSRTFVVCKYIYRYRWRLCKFVTILTCQLQIRLRSQRSCRVGHNERS